MLVYDVPNANSKRDKYTTGNAQGAAGLLVAYKDYHQFAMTQPLRRDTKRVSDAGKDAARLMASVLADVADHGVVIVPGTRTKRIYCETWGQPLVLAQVAREL